MDIGRFGVGVAVPVRYGCKDSGIGRHTEHGADNGVMLLGIQFQCLIHLFAGQILHAEDHCLQRMAARVYGNGWYLVHASHERLLRKKHQVMCADLLTARAQARRLARRVLNYTLKTKKVLWGDNEYGRRTREIFLASGFSTWLTNRFRLTGKHLIYIGSYRNETTTWLTELVDQSDFSLVDKI